MRLRTPLALAAASFALLTIGQGTVSAAPLADGTAAAHSGPSALSGRSGPTGFSGRSGLTDLSAERIGLADKVAAAKFGTGRPVDDPARERRLLADVARRSAPLGLDPRETTAVFRDQIEANKLVQRGLFRRWAAHPEERPARRPDLAREVRPALDTLTTRLLEALREREAARRAGTCAPRLARDAVRTAYEHRFDALHGAGLARALPSVCAAATVGPAARDASSAPRGVPGSGPRRDR